MHRRSWAAPGRQAAATLDLDGGGDVDALLDRRDTWSGRTVLWPAADGRTVVPVDLAGLPAYDRDRTFTGFNGFGIIRMGDALEKANEEVIEADGQGIRTLSPQDRMTFDEIGNRLADRRADEEFDEGDDTNIVLGVTGAAALATGVSVNVEEAEVEAEDRSDLAPDDKQADTAAELTSEGPEDASPTPADVGDEPALLDVSDDEPDDGLVSGEEVAATERVAEPAAEADQTPVAYLPSAFVQARAVAADNVEDDNVDDAGDAEPDEEAVEDLSANGGLGDVRDEPMSETGPTDAAETLGPVASLSNIGEMAETLPETEAELPGVAPDDMVTAGATKRPKPEVPDHSVDTSLLARLPIPLLIYRDHELLFANPDFYNLTGYSSLDDFAEAGGVERLFGATDDQQRNGPGAPIYHRNGELLDVRAHLQHVPWDAARAMLLTLRPGGGPDGRRTEPTPDLPNEAGNIVSFSQSKPERDTGGDIGGSGFGGVGIDDLRAVLDTATDGVIILTATGVVRAASRSAEALLDRQSADMAGCELTQFLAPESRDRLADYLTGIRGGGVERLLNDGREFMLRTPGGGLVPVFMTIGRLTEADTLCAVVRDVTAWRRTEEELLQAKSTAELANEQKTGFLARISHEIRTPLNAIIGFSDLMIDERFGRIENDRYRGYLRDIHRSGSHVLDIVNDLLDISKIEAGKLDLTFDACDLNLLVSNCVATMQAQANTHRIIIRSSLSAVVPKLVADQRSLKQIILNLVSNSIKFTRAGGQVIVSTVYDQSGEVALRVRDTGIGMSAQELEQAMQPFQQVATVPARMPARMNEQRGTGLGLPLTRAMAEANRASFTIESEPEEGTLVEIRFPASRVLVDGQDQAV